MIFGTMRKGIMELLDDRLGDFWAEFVAGQLGTHGELRACGALESFGEEDPITSSCHEGSKVGNESCLPVDRFHDWIATEVS